VQSGTGWKAAVVPDARGKTGTTNEAKDAWFTGYTDGVLGVGWVGNQRKGKLQPMRDNVFGGTVTAGIWAEIMKVARDKYGKKPAVIAAPEKKPAEPKAGPDVDPDLTATGAAAPPPPATDNNSGDPTAVTADSGSNDSSTDNGTPVKPDPAKADAAAGDPAKPPKDKPAILADTTLPAKPAKPRRAKPDDDSKADTVTVDICEDSGLLATPYCPETITRTFKRGKEPKKKCRIHGPGN